jgi:hypothetical protein
MITVSRRIALSGKFGISVRPQRDAGMPLQLQVAVSADIAAWGF